MSAKNMVQCECSAVNIVAIVSVSCNEVSSALEQCLVHIWSSVNIC